MNSAVLLGWQQTDGSLAMTRLSTSERPDELLEFLNTAKPNVRGSTDLMNLALWLVIRDQGLLGRFTHKLQVFHCVDELFVGMREQSANFAFVLQKNTKWVKVHSIT